MAKQRVEFRCDECGMSAPRWSGRCPACDAWNTMVEAPVLAIGAIDPRLARLRTGYADRRRRRSTRRRAMPTGISELDRVLGGGFVPGSVTLDRWRAGGRQVHPAHAGARHRWRTPTADVLYVSAEESRHQVRLRAERLDALSPRSLAGIRDRAAARAGTGRRVRPGVVVIDSIQTVHDPALGSAPGLGRAGPRVRPPARAGGQGARPGRRPRRPRDEGRWPRRTTRARARRRHRAVLRRRPAPRAAVASCDEAPVRVDRTNWDCSR